MRDKSSVPRLRSAFSRNIAINTNDIPDRRYETSLSIPHIKLFLSADDILQVKSKNAF